MTNSSIGISPENIQASSIIGVDLSSTDLQTALLNGIAELNGVSGDQLLDQNRYAFAAIAVLLWWILGAMTIFVVLLIKHFIRKTLL